MMLFTFEAGTYCKTLQTSLNVCLTGAVTKVCRMVDDRVSRGWAPPWEAVVGRESES